MNRSMWVCSKCGEPHQDQFKECWKCAGIEMEKSEHVMPGPPPVTLPPPERRLRSTGSVLARAAVGFLIGAVLSLSSLNFVNPQTLMPGQEMTPGSKTVFALVIGAIFGLIVGLFFWVLFPYEATAEPTQTEIENDEQAP